MTVTVDINVLLDVFQMRQPHYTASAQVLSLVAAGTLAGVCPAHGLTTLYYLVRKYATKADAEAAMDRVLRLSRSAISKPKAGKRRGGSRSQILKIRSLRPWPKPPLPLSSSRATQRISLALPFLRLRRRTSSASLNTPTIKEESHRAL